MMHLVHTLLHRWLPGCAIALAMLPPAHAQQAAVTPPAAVSAGKSLSAQPPSPQPTKLRQRYPAGSIASEDIASKALKDVKKEQSAIEARFKFEEKICYDKEFLANKCRDQAKERRRLALAEAKEIQIEANQYKRHAAVAKREQALAAKRESEQEDAKTRATSAEEREKRMAEKQLRSKKKRQTSENERADKETTHAEKLRKAEERQRKLAEKKAKKEEKRKKKEAAQARKDQPLPAATDGPTKR